MPARAHIWFAVALLWAAVLLGSGVPAAVAGTGTVAFDADLTGDGEHATLTVALSGPVSPRHFVLERPDRVVVEVPDLNCQLPAIAGRKHESIVAGIRCGLVAFGRSRLVIELARPATVARLDVMEGRVPGTRTLVLELAKADREAFRRTIRAEPAPDPSTTGSLPADAGKDRRPLVVLDPGHGGIDPGARAMAGDNEKDIVLGFAQTLRDRLVAGGAVRVLMTRDSDVFVPLDERVSIARAAGAELFVSIHADSIMTPAIRGATIYTGAERATDLELARLAERENQADAVAGIAPGAASGVTDILQDLTVRETRGFSHRFAAMLQGDLGAVTRFTAQPHREAGFRVLRAADMTSCLVELGYVSNPKDADLLLSEGWRGRTAAAMAGAIERFLGPRLAGRAAVSP